MKVTHIAAFYRGTDPAAGFECTLAGPAADQLWRTVTARADEIWQEAAASDTRDELVQRMRRQLAACGGGRRLPGMDDEQSAAQAIGNLYLLERHGLLEPDEHNGIVLAIDAMDVVHVVPDLKRALRLMEEIKASGGRRH